MNERDSIASILRGSDPTETLLLEEDCRRMASALLAAGYSKANLEKAWDEGYIVGALDSAINDQPAPNPYRREGGAA
jgi:hypothetical protein